MIFWLIVFDFFDIVEKYLFCMFCYFFLYFFGFVFLDVSGIGKVFVLLFDVFYGVEFWLLKRVLDVYIIYILF